MKQSEQLKLWLPEGSDPLEVSKLSENFEKLDPLGGGLELMKEGTGPGSLFCVSKHYKEPIKNALLCNGGTASANAYPELYNVLGLNYTGTLGYDTLNSYYGTTSIVSGNTDTHPIAYNEDKDMFLTLDLNNSRVICYKRGVAPTYVSLPDVGEGLYKYSGANNVWATIASYGNFITVNYPAKSTTNANNDVAWLFTATYDLSAGKWGTVSKSYKSFDNSTYLDVGKYMATPSGALYNKATNLIHKVSYYINGTLVSGVKGVLVNLDDPSDEKIYVIVYKGYVVYVGYVNTADVDAAPTSGSSVPVNVNAISAITLDSSTINNNNYSGITGVILRNQVIGKGSSSIVIVRIPLTETSSIYTYTPTGATSASFGPTPACFGSLLRLSDTVLGIVSFSNKLPSTSSMSSNTSSTSSVAVAKTYPTVYIQFDLTTNTATGVTIPFGGSTDRVAHLRSTKMATEKGAIDNIRIANFKLPTITMSESLVYMRTKSAEGG